MGTGHALLLDTNPFINLLDHYVAGDGRANENFALTSIHTIWARNHNFHVEKLLKPRASRARRRSCSRRPR